MISLLLRLLRDQRVRYLLVGGVNTLVGFGTFVLADLTIGHGLDSIGQTIVASVATLVVSHIISVLIAFALYRRLVFRVTGNVLIDLLRFESVYLVSLGVNLVVLPLVVEWGAPRILAQAVITIVMTVFSYLAHRYFSFRRRSRPPAQEREAGADGLPAPAEGDEPRGLRHPRRESP